MRIDINNNISSGVLRGTDDPLSRLPVSPDYTVGGARIQTPAWIEGRWVQVMRRASRNQRKRRRKRQRK